MTLGASAGRYRKTGPRRNRQTAGSRTGDLMPRHTTGRPASGRGVRTPSEARPSVRRPAPVRLSRTAARECAARLMASGPALPVPRLAVGCLEPFQPSNTYSGAFDLARNLLLAGVGQPEDWERSKGDPVAFMLRTVERDRRRLQSQGHRCGCPYGHPLRHQPLYLELAREGIRRSGSGVPGG